MRVSSVLSFLWILGTFSAGADPWLQVSVDEIGAASPIKAIAVMPVRLASAAFQAVPAKYRKDALDEGFDLSEISQKIQGLSVGQRTAIVHNKMSIRAAKFDKKNETATSPSYLVIRLNGAKITCPLLFTGTAIQILTMVFKDLQPVKKQLKTVMNEAKTAPPGRLLWCTDQRDTLEILLK